MNGIVPMALSFSVGYFLLRLLTLGLFFAEKGNLIFSATHRLHGSCFTDLYRTFISISIWSL